MIEKEHQNQIKKLTELAIHTYREEINFHHDRRAMHQQEIDKLEKTIEEAEKYLKSIPILMLPNQPLTRNYIREYLKNIDAPKKSVELVDALYFGISVQERSKLIKRVSVMMNQMQKEDEIIITKTEGIKGNYYELKK